MSLEEYKKNKFEQMTIRLKDALKRIRQNPTIPATQDSIINLTGCGRRLLSTPKRKWVMDDLDAIKKERLREFAEPDEGESGRNLTDIDVLTELVAKQNMRIETLHAECGELFDRILRLEGENRSLNQENAELKTKWDGKSP